jgi:hypothetical protein
VRLLNGASPQPRDYVLYWMTSFRRTKSNFALDRAIELAKQLKKPLLVFEALRVGYQFANDRLHTFVLEGMRANERAFEGSPVKYVPFVERKRGDGRGLMEALVERACVVVGDDWPCFFVPRMQQLVADRIDCRFEVVDSNGVYPMHDTPRVFTTAHSFRVHLQKVLPAHLMQFPTEEPLARLELPKFDVPLPTKWKFGLEVSIADLPIDHSVRAVPIPGGSDAAEKRLTQFILKIFPGYVESRNEPELDGTSALSPYLHFGHISSHQIFAKVVGTEKWSVEKLGPSIGGAKEGWWQLSPSAEGYLDQLVTWRELSFNMTSHRPDAERAARLRTRDDSQTRGRQTRACVFAHRPRTEPYARPLVERGDGPAPRDGLVPQLRAHVVGEEDLRVVEERRRRAARDGVLDGQVLHRWSRPDFVQRLLLDSRALRPRVGPGAAGVRLAPVHDVRQHREEVEREELHGPFRAEER